MRLLQQTRSLQAALLLLAVSTSNRHVAVFPPPLSPLQLSNLRVAPSFSIPTITTATRLHMSSSSSTPNLNPALALYERFQDKLPSQKIIDACDGQQRVIASDIAAKAGVSLNQAQRELTLLASLSQGDLAVSQDGELLYSFPKNLSGVLAEQSRQYKLQQSVQKVWPALFWGIRVSFGVALVASLVAIYSTIFFIQTSSNESNDNRRDDRRGGMGGGGFGGFNYFWGPSPFDFFYYRPYGSYGYYGTQYQNERRDPEDLGFFESVYSFVFGDGNPNAQLEQRRLQLAAQMIRANQGAVTAEQLAPFCDPDITPEQAMQSNFVDEVRICFVLSGCLLDLFLSLID